MKSINTFAVGMRVAGAARALPASTWTAHAASAHATAPVAPAQRKRRNATRFVDGGTI